MTEQPMLWSVRREVWENRSVYVAPLIVTAVVLFSLAVNSMTLPRRVEMRAGSAHSLVKPYSVAPAPIMFITFVVGFFYSLDALYGERRDRSILFWKSLPVSDRTTVLSKAAIPLVVLPLIAFVLSVLTVINLFFLSSAVLMTRGISPGAVWGGYNFIVEPAVMLYGLAVHALWFAPIYCWLIFVSAWAKRTPFLWAVLPFFIIGVVERMTLGTTYFAKWLQWRWMGAMVRGFGMSSTTHNVPNIEHLWQLTPGRFLLTPGLWVGLIVAAAFLAASIQLRRNREPI